MQRHAAQAARNTVAVLFEIDVMGVVRVMRVSVMTAFRAKSSADGNLNSVNKE